jgi:hypothetical protein
MTADDTADDTDASASPLLQLYEGVLASGHALSLRAHRRASSWCFVTTRCWRGLAAALAAAPGGGAPTLSPDAVRGLLTHLVSARAWSAVARATARPHSRPPAKRR